MRIDAAVVAAVVLLVATGKAQVSSRPESSAALTSSVSSSDESSRVPNTNISTVAGPGDPNIAAMFDGSYRGPLLPALVPTPAREYRRQAAASSSTVNVSNELATICRRALLTALTSVRSSDCSSVPRLQRVALCRRQWRKLHCMSKSRSVAIAAGVV